MTLIDIVLWIIVGAIAGWVAQLIVGGGYGVLGTIVLGIVGAVVGGFIGQALNLGGTSNNPFNIVNLVLAVIGAIVVVLVARAISGRRTVV
jgi:uncharacterized membrane protein YeaQ/YmgE (transglycosylase-associated protein family)